MSGELQLVPHSINFPETEKDTLVLWDKTDAFKETLRRSKEADLPRFTFYDVSEGASHRLQHLSHAPRRALRSPRGCRTTDTSCAAR